MGQDRLHDLALLSVERKEVNFEDITDKFAALKAKNIKLLVFTLRDKNVMNNEDIFSFFPESNSCLTKK